MQKSERVTAQNSEASEWTNKRIVESERKKKKLHWCEIYTFDVSVHCTTTSRTQNEKSRISSSDIFFLSRFSFLAFHFE